MAETKAVIFSDGKFQGIGNNGQVVPYGKLYFYESVTGNQVETYTTSTMETLNTFPIVLSASGKADVYIGDGQYDVTLLDKNGVNEWTINNYIPAGGQIQLNPVESIPTREEFTGIVGSSIILDQTPSTTVIVHKNGLLLVEADYTLDGKTIVFTTPLIVTDVVIVEFSAIVTAGVNTGLVYDVDNITDLLSVDISYGTVNVQGYTTPNDGGGGIFNYDATIDKSTANGGTIVDPSVSLANQGTGVGLGAWVRQNRKNMKLIMFGISENVISNIPTISGLITGDSIILDGYNSVSDGGGGTFIYDSTQSAVNNGGTIINGWVRQHDGVLNAKQFGAYGDGVADDSDALQAIEDAYQSNGGFYIEYTYGTYKITKQINYVSGLRRFSFATISGTGAFSNFFSPKDATKWATTDTEFHNFVFLDSDATTDNGGSTSTKRGIDFTTTSNCFAYNTKGVLLNKVLGADPAPVGVHQYTRRVHIHGIDGSDVNYLFDFEPVADNNFAHGDIEITGVYNVGSTRWGGRCEDADGFTYEGSTMFPSGHLTCSGNYILVDSSKQFEPAAADYAVIAPNGLRVKTRAGGLQSTKVTIKGLQVAKGGAAGLYGVAGAAGAGILLEDVYGFSVDATCNDCSTESIVMTNCVNGTFNIVSNNANSQAITNPQTINTYDAISMLSCTNVRGVVSAGGVTHRFIAYIDDICTGCAVDASGEFGGVRIPLNSKNSYTWNRNGSMISYNSDGIATIPYSGNETAPSMNGWNNSLIVFSNSATTNVTDIVGGESFNTIKVIIQDGVTKLLNVAGGGNFVFKNAGFIAAGGMTGILTAATFVKNSVNGNWVEIG